MFFTTLLWFLVINIRLFFALLLFISPLLLFLPQANAESADSQKSIKTFQYKSALQASQDAIGRTLGSFSLTDAHGKAISTQTFLGKPLVISMVYTSCYKTCPMTIRHLAKVVEKARETLGKDSFSVAVIGFDTQYDSPQAMRLFAKKQGIENSGWYILSADSKTIATLTQELGFEFFPSPNGFDHVVQATVVDAAGKIYRQVYGEVFDTQLLVEPLIELVLGQPKPSQSFFATLVDNVRFFCTTYDPYTDSYQFDYSLFIGLFIGLSIIIYTIIFIVREYRYGKRPPGI